jgi:hypothetical protein
MPFITFRPNIEDTPPKAKPQFVQPGAEVSGGFSEGLGTGAGFGIALGLVSVGVAIARSKSGNKKPAKQAKL